MVALPVYRDPPTSLSRKVTQVATKLSLSKMRT